MFPQGLNPCGNTREHTSWREHTQKKTMRLTTNDKLIERQSKIARYASFAGLAILLGSLIISFQSGGNLLLSYVSLFVGFGLAYFGAVLANKYIKEPRADHALAKALKGFDNKHHLYNYLLPAPHVLLTPTGVLVFKVKSNDGAIFCRGDKWRNTWQWTRLLGGMGQEPLGNPSADLRADIEKIKQLLANKLEGAAAMPVDGYVVFTSPRAQLSLEEPSVPVVRVEELKETLRKTKRGAPLPQKTLDDLAKILDAKANPKAA